MLRNFIFGISIFLAIALIYINFNQIKVSDFVSENDTTETSSKIENVKIATLSKGNLNLKLEIVATPETREQGLSDRENIGAYDGMLFIFPESSYQTFWMKDMQFDLDMIWLDENRKVVWIDEDAKASSYNSIHPELSKKFSAPTKILYVIEVPAGFAKAKNINLGDVFEIKY